MTTEATGTAQPFDPPSPCGRGLARERAICDAALELLGEVGYDRMTMDAVAARARASKATIYRRWPGKRELVLEAVRSSHGVALPDLPDLGSLREDLLFALRVSAEGIVRRDTELLSGLLRATQEAPDLGDCMREQVIEAKRRLSETIIARAVARGEVPASADPSIVHEVAGALMFYRALVLGAPFDDAFLHHVVDDVLVPLLSRR